MGRVWFNFAFLCSSLRSLSSLDHIFFIYWFFFFGVQIVDPKLASYGVENPIYAVIQLAQTTMRSELGKITLDKTFEERDTLNEKIVVSLVISSSNLLFVLVILLPFPYKRKHLRYFNFKSRIKPCWWKYSIKQNIK